MSRRILFLCMLIPVISIYSYAANILLWHYDYANGDSYNDPEAGEQVRCDYWIKKSLEANGYTFEYHDATELPNDANTYDVIVATLGYYGC